MLNAIHEVLSHKDRFALEYVVITSPDCPVQNHKFIVGVALVENGNVVHKIVPSKDMDFWLVRGLKSRVAMTFPSTLPSEHLEQWRQKCQEHQVDFTIVAHEFSDSEQRRHQTIVEGCTVTPRKKRMAA